MPKFYSKILNSLKLTIKKKSKLIKLKLTIKIDLNYLN